MNILHIIPYYHPARAYGGSVQVAAELCTELAALGHQVTVLTTDTLDAHSRLPAGETQIDGVTVIRHRNLSNALAWKRLFMPLGFGVGLNQQIARHDVVHIHEYRSLQNVFALAALKRQPRPYVLTSHGGFPPELGRTGIKHLYDQLVGRRLLAGAARLHAITEMERQQYLNAGLPDEKIAVIHNGIDVGAFDIEADSEVFKRRFDIPPGCPVVGFLGRINQIKGVDFLVEAFAAVLAHLPEAVLVLVGPDDGYQAALEAQIERLGIGASVRLTGYIGDMETKAAAYRAFDVYVLPSRYEMQPATILESLLNNTPGILSDRCGIAPNLAAAGLVEVAAYGDVEQLARQIIALIDHRAAMQEEIARRREYVRERFNWQYVARQWETLYRQGAEKIKY